MHTLKEIYTSQQGHCLFGWTLYTLQYLLTSFILGVGAGEMESEESIFIFDSYTVRVFYIRYDILYGRQLLHQKYLQVLSAN